jgi:hypothetical protein
MSSEASASTLGALQMHAPLWNGQKLSRVSSVDTSSYVMGLGFNHNRFVETGGVPIYAIYSRSDREIWIPLLRGSIDYLNQICVFINDIALIEGVSQSDVYDSIIAMSIWGKDAK